MVIVILFTDADESSFLTIMKLVEQIPGELITVEAARYYALLAALNSMRTAISRWQGGRSYTLKYVQGYDSQDLITLVRQVLDDRPDELPSSDTAELSFIEDQAIRENLRIDISAMNRALSSGEWSAATVLAGSILEALLLWVLHRQDEEKRETAIANAVKKAGVKKPPTNLEKRDLHRFIEVAAEGEVISADTA
jgi:hypothetical protein